MVTNQKSTYDIDLECELVEELEREAYALTLKGESIAAMKNFEKVSRICLPCMKTTEGMVCKIK